MVGELEWLPRPAARARSLPEPGKQGPAPPYLEPALPGCDAVWPFACAHSRPTPPGPTPPGRSAPPKLEGRDWNLPRRNGTQAPVPAARQAPPAAFPMFWREAKGTRLERLVPPVGAAASRA